MPGSAGALVFVGGQALLLWRDPSGWEIPLGEIGPGEDAQVAAARHVEEQTGWRPGPLQPLIRVRSAGDDHAIFVANRASPGAEERRTMWVPVLRVQELIDEQAITSATTTAALLYQLADLLQVRAVH
ncbi:MAG: NUDIX domain-containing protein [Nonomuraea sp.]|nr:NUDIX domain-containing protein [Nonomuraea sp.]